MHIDTSKYYIFYDGDCGFCNYWVRWILEKDRKDAFLFASLQSHFGQIFLRERQLNHKVFDTVYLWKPNGFYLTEADAIAKILKILGGKYAIFSILNSILPSFISNFLYQQIAKNRQKLNASSCGVLNEKDKKKFIQ